MKKPFPPIRPLPPIAYQSANYNVRNHTLEFNNVSHYKPHIGNQDLTLQALISQVKALGIDEDDFATVHFELSRVTVCNPELKCLQKVNERFDRDFEKYTQELERYKQDYKKFEVENAQYFKEKKIKTAKDAVKTLKAAGVNVEKLLQEQGE